MKTLTVDHRNGNKTVYQLIEDTGNLPIAYHEETNIEVIKALERARRNRTRVRIYLGDAKSGKSWNEENDVLGYIGLSKGYEARFPILVFNDRSFGGVSILDHCIVKIKASSGGQILYQHPNYKNPVIKITGSDLPEYTHNVIIDGQLYGRCRSLKSASNLQRKMS